MVAILCYKLQLGLPFQEKYNFKLHFPFFFFFPIYFVPEDLVYTHDYWICSKYCGLLVLQNFRPDWAEQNNTMILAELM